VSSGGVFWPLADPTAAEAPAFFQQLLEPALRDAGVTVVATYTTEHSENTCRALPIRENENVFIWISLFEDEADHGRHVRDLERSSVWRGASRVLARHIAGSEEILGLCPTARSAIHA
jgi:hypothetical protein